MLRIWVGPTALLLASLFQATEAAAAPQNGGAASEPRKPPSSSEARPPAVDVSQLPLNLTRIERQLRRSAEREERDGLNLRYIIDVYGQAPPIELFTPQDNLLHGPVPYGGPTHRDMLRVMTPQEFRAPAADFGNLIRWLSGKKD